MFEHHFEHSSGDIFENTLRDSEIYFFANEASKLNASLMDLKKNNSNIKYLQVESNNNCIPYSLFLGYDSFMVYSLFRAMGN